jgi:iron complex outermembrane recepter protein
MLRIYIIYFNFLCIFFFGSQFLLSQQCLITVNGKISDHHQNHELEYATIFVQEMQQGVVTDEKGFFELRSMCAGQYHFVISHIGCESKTLYIDIKSDTTLHITMEHHDELLDEVTIKGQDIQSKTGMMKSVISKDMMLDLSGKNLTEMLAAVPGVSMLRSGPNLSKPIIHGVYGNRITILNHGIPQEGQQWGNDHAPEIDPNTGDKLSVYKGANAIKYGLSTVGGLVIIEPNELTHDPHWHGDIKLKGQSNGRVFGLQTVLLKSTALGNTRWTAGYNQSGDKKSAEYFLTNTGNKEKSFSFLISNNPTTRTSRKFFYSFYNNEIGILRGSHIGNLTDLQEAFTRKVPFFTQDQFSYQINAPRQVVSHHLAKYSHKHHFSDRYNLVFEGAFQTNIRQEYDVRRGDRSSKPSLDLTLLSQYYDLQLNHQPSTPHIHHALGVQYKNNNNTNRPGTGIRPLIPDYINLHLALYYILKNKIGTFPLELGVRSEYRDYQIFRTAENGEKSRFQLFNIGASLGFKKEITTELNTLLDISYTGRPPEVNELYSNGLHQGVSGIEEGNPNLTTEKSFKIVNEWNGHLSHRHHINISLFFNRFWNYIYLQPADELRLTIRGAFSVFKYVGADVNMAGSSIKSNFEINSRFQWSNAIHYTYAQNLTLNQGLIRIPPLSITSNLNYTIGKSKLYHEMKSGIELNYTARQSRVNVREDFLAPPDGYILTNVFMRIKWKTKKQNDLDLIIRCENLWNTSYRDYLNRLRYFADEVGRNIYFNFNISF